MALKNLEAAALMADAWAMQARGEELLAAGDWRDAAEKGWLAVRNATAAVALAAAGVGDLDSTGVNAGIRKLARERGGEWVRLREGFTEVVHNLRGEAFYGGVYSDEIPDLVRGTADYIRRAEDLAGA